MFPDHGLEAASFRSAFRRTLLAGLTCLAVGPLGCPEAEQTSGAGVATVRDVLLITLDTTRADALGSAAGGRGRTPALDGLVEESLRFSQAITVAPYTGPAHASLLTGLYPPQHGLRDFLAQRLPDSALTLAEILREHGYATAAFVSAYPLDPEYGLNQGFDLYSTGAESDRGGSTERTPSQRFHRRAADETVAEAIGWLRERSDGRPFFVWVHLYDPHAPTRPPPAFRRRAAPGGGPLERRRRLYYDSVTFMDSEIGRLLSALDALGRWKDLVVVVVADHGELLGEYGRPQQGHSPWLTEATLRVPLLIRAPGRAEPARIDQPVSVVDVMPSVLDALGLSAPRPLSGRSLLAPGPPRSAEYSETFYEHFPQRAEPGQELVSLRSKGWKLLASNGKPRLYRLADDPGELRDVAAQNPDRVAELLQQWRTLSRRWPEAHRGALLQFDAERRRAHEEALRSLGYLE